MRIGLLKKNIILTISSEQFSLNFFFTFSPSYSSYSTILPSGKDLSASRCFPLTLKINIFPLYILSLLSYSSSFLFFILSSYLASPASGDEQQSINQSIAFPRPQKGNQEGWGPRILVATSLDRPKYPEIFTSFLDDTLCTFSRV